MWCSKNQDLLKGKYDAVTFWLEDWRKKKPNTKPGEKEVCSKSYDSGWEGWEAFWFGFFFLCAVYLVFGLEYCIYFFLSGGLEEKRNLMKQLQTMTEKYATRTTSNASMKKETRPHPISSCQNKTVIDDKWNTNKQKIPYLLLKMGISSSFWVLSK